MRYAIAAIYLIVAGLAIVFFVTRPQPAREKPADSVELQAHKSATDDPQSDVGELRREVDELKAQVRELRGNGSAPTESEFVEKHRQSILRVLDDAQWSRKLDELTEACTMMAKMQGEHFDLPKSARPPLEEFGGEYGRRLGHILESVRKELGPSVPLEKPWPPAQVREMQDLDAWAQGRLAEIDGEHAKALWDAFSVLRTGCYGLLKMP
jgi:hypothetical protein